MALVQGEDSESDEEINTDQLSEGALGHLQGSKFSPLRPDQPKASIVAGEESETDEEDDGSAPPLDQPDGPRAHAHLSQPPGLSSHGGSSRDLDTASRSSLESGPSAPPPSLMHKRLRETNISLRRGIVERILKMYHATCHNLSVVNDKLTRAQGTVEKVNAHLKRSDNELSQLNTAMKELHTEALTFAPTLRIGLVLPARQHGTATPVAMPATPEMGSAVSSPSPPPVASAEVEETK